MPDETRRTAAETMWLEYAKPCPQIVEILEHECSDGAWRSVWGLPHGVTFTGTKRVAGYAYSDGRSTYGRREKSRDILEARWVAGHERDRNDFIAALLDEPDTIWNERVAHWQSRQIARIARLEAARTLHTGRVGGGHGAR